MEEQVLVDSQWLNSFAHRADELIDSGDIEELKGFADNTYQPNFVFEHDVYKAQLFYILGNCYDRIYNAHNTKWYSEELGKALLFFRKALYLLMNEEATEETAQLLSCVQTNLANTLSTQGRYFDAIPLYDHAIDLHNHVALIGKARNQLAIADSVFDPTHKNIHYKITYQIAKEAVAKKEQIHPAIQQALEEGSPLRSFMKWYEQELLPLELELEPYEAEYESRKIEDFHKWCGNQCLFINDLNDVINNDEVYHDVLGLASFTQEINTTLSMSEELSYHYHFDELKNEYCYARYLVFTAINIPDEQPHFFNSTFRHVDTGDWVIMNLKTNHYKTAFRTLYSTFDKLAYFVHRFFELDEISRDRRVSFDSIFKKETNNRKKNRVFEPHPKLAEIDNYFLHALFFILKDIRKVQVDVDNENDLSFWLDPDSKSFADIRNALEHRSLKICEDFGYSMRATNEEFYQQRITELEQEKQTHIEAIRTLRDKKKSVNKGDAEQLSTIETEIEKLQNKIERIDCHFYEKQKLSTHSLTIPLSEMQSRSMTLIILVRNAIMYLSLAIHLEQEKRNGDNKIYVPMEVPLKD